VGHQLWKLEVCSSSVDPAALLNSCLIALVADLQGSEKPPGGSFLKLF